MVFTPTRLIERESVAAPPADGAARARSTKAKREQSAPAMIKVFVSHPTRQARRTTSGREGACRRCRRSRKCDFNPRRASCRSPNSSPPRSDCDALIAYRQTPGPETPLSRPAARWLAFMRCAVDIRTVDVEAASAHGVLVTQASPGYVAAVAEWIVARHDRPRARHRPLCRGISRAIGRPRRSWAANCAARRWASSASARSAST